jgi:hypothetical protein
MLMTILLTRSAVYGICSMRRLAFNSFLEVTLLLRCLSPIIKKVPPNRIWSESRLKQAGSKYDVYYNNELLLLPGRWGVYYLPLQYNTKIKKILIFNMLIIS